MHLGWEQMSLDEREREYSPSSCIGGNYKPFVDDYRRLSAVAHAGHPPATYRYGAEATQTLDLFLPIDSASRPPLLVFFHGGYWQELSKADSAFPAPQAIAHGIAYAAIDYTLAPMASLDAIVDECVQAIDWLINFGAVIGIDSRRIFVAGSSAGAHLAAMVALQRPDLGGAILVSGVYDIAPLAGTSIDGALRLTAATIRQNSPLLADLSSFPPTIIAWGEVETSQSKKQSQALASRLQLAGAACRSLEVGGRNHFDVVFDLADPAAMLGDRVHALIRNGAV